MVPSATCGMRTVVDAAVDLAIRRKRPIAVRAVVAFTRDVDRGDRTGVFRMRRLGLQAVAIGVVLAFPAVCPAFAQAATGDPEILLNSIPAQSNGSTFSGQVATLVTSGQTDVPSDWSISINWGDGTGPDTTTATVSGGACEPVPQGGTYIPNGGVCGEAGNGSDPVYTVSTSGHTFQGSGPYSFSLTASGTYTNGPNPGPATNTASETILGPGPPPSPQVVLDSIPAQGPGTTFTGQVATIVGSIGTLNQSDWATQISWGDGTAIDQGAAVTGPDCEVPPAGATFVSTTFCTQPGEDPVYTISDSHTFEDAGPYSISVEASATYNSEPYSGLGRGTIPSNVCATTATLGYASLELLGPGCITTAGPAQTTPMGVDVMVNGIEIDPGSSGELTLDSATGQLISTGPVTLKLGCSSCGQPQVAFSPQAIEWRVVPNPGETQIGVGGPGTFQLPSGSTLLQLPALSENSIDLMSGGQSTMSFEVGVPLPSLGSLGVVTASTQVLSSNTGGAQFNGLSAMIAVTNLFKVGKGTQAAPLFAFYGALSFTLSTDTWAVSLDFLMPPVGSVQGSAKVIDGVPTAISLGGSYTDPGLAIGDTGVFLQSLSGGFEDYPMVQEPEIGLTSSTGNAATDAANTSTCASINSNYANFLASNQALPSYCGQTGTITFAPPLEVDGAMTLSVGPVIDTRSALTVNGQFRLDNSYFNGFQNVPWEVDVQGSVSMVSLPFNQAPADAYPNTSPGSGGKFAPINNAGTEGWVTLNGDGVVEAGGGMDYKFPQNTNNWLLDLNGEVAVSLVPNGATIPLGSGQSPEQYAAAVQSQANSWAVVGSVTGNVCVQIPDVASGCAIGAGAISNVGIGGCASFSLPGTADLETVANGVDSALNAVAAVGEAIGNAAPGVVSTLGSDATTAADDTGSFLSNAASTTSSAADTFTGAVGGAFSKVFAPNLPSADHPGLAHAADERAAAADPVAHAADSGPLPTNVVVPQVNYAIGAVYNWANGSTTPLTTCSNQALVSALSAQVEARIADARGVPSLRVRVGRSGAAPRLFVITGATAAPDVIVVGPDRRAIRTKGPGFVEPGWIVEKDKQLKTTYVWAVDAPAGKWDFLAVPHSSRILRVRTAAGIPITVVTASVRGERKHAYAVRYRVADRTAGETITIEETDGTGATIPVATVRGSRGTIDWTPSAKLFRPVRVLLAVIKRGASLVSAEPLLGFNLKTHAVIKSKTKTPKPKHK
jgi:hypothetical protein